MPGTFAERDILDAMPIAADQQVGGDRHPGDGAKVGVSLGVEAGEEKVVDPGPAEFPGRQTDVVDDQQVDDRARRPGVAVWRGAPLHTAEPAIGIDGSDELPGPGR